MFCGSRRRKKGTNTRTPQKNGLYCMGGRRGGATSQGWVGKGPQSTFASRKNRSTVTAGKEGGARSCQDRCPACALPPVRLGSLSHRPRSRAKIPPDAQEYRFRQERMRRESHYLCTLRA